MPTGVQPSRPFDRARVGVRPAALLATLAALGAACDALPAGLANESDAAEGESIDERYYELERRRSNDLFTPRTVGELADSRSCSTAVAAPLNAQIAAEMNCLHPGLLVFIGDLPKVTLGPAASPYLQKRAAGVLRSAAAKSEGATPTVNSAWRSVAQQYVLQHWVGSCGIGEAAAPGHSAHEIGLAVDVASGAAPAFARELRREGFHWFCDVTNAGKLGGCHDPPHYTFEGGRDLRPLGVLAFQRLWNRAHAGDPRQRIEEDGQFRAGTEAALRRSPLAGFALRGGC